MGNGRIFNLTGSQGTGNVDLTEGETLAELFKRKEIVIHDQFEVKVNANKVDQKQFDNFVVPENAQITITKKSKGN